MILVPSLFTATVWIMPRWPGGSVISGRPERASQIRIVRSPLELAKVLQPDTAQFYPLMVYPGTAAYEWAVQDGLIEAKSYKEWLTPEGLHTGLHH